MRYIQYNSSGDPLNWPMGMALFVDGSIGLFCNIFIIVTFFSNSDKTSFKLICLIRAINNTITLWVMVTDATPLTLGGFTFYPYVLEDFMWVFLMLIYGVNRHSLVILAFNRFVALYIPSTYNLLCGIKTTLVYFLIAYGYELKLIPEIIMWYLSPDNEDPEDQFKSAFHPETMTMFYDYIGQDDEYQDMNVNLAQENVMEFCIGVLINLLTLGKLVYFYMYQAQLNTQTSKEKIKMNAVLFLQTVLQDSMLIVDITFMIFLQNLWRTRFWLFISYTFVWMNIHTIDGVVMLLFTEQKKHLVAFCQRYYPSEESKRWAKISPNSSKVSQAVIGLLGLPYARPPIKDDRFLTSYLQKLGTDRKYDKWPNRCIKEYILEGTSEDCLYVSLLRHKDTKTKTNTLLFVTNEDLSVNKLLNMVKPELNIAVGYAGGLPLSISDTVNMVKLLKAYSDTLLIRNLTVMAEGTVAESVNGAMNEIGYIIDQAILINGNQLTRTYDRQDYQRITEEMIKKETSKAFHPMGDPFRVPFVEKLPETQVPTILGLYKRPTTDYPLDANFTEAYSQKDFKRFLSLLIPDTLHKNARLLRRQIMHQYIYTKGEKTNLYFLFEELKTILLDRDFLAPTYKLTMHLADKKNTVWLLEHGIDNPPRNCWQDGGWDDIQPFCDKLTAYFTRFAEKGAPTEDSCNPVNPTFPAMRSTKRDYYVIMHADGKPEWEFRYHKEAVELWNHLLPALDKLELTGDGDAIFKNMNTLMAKKSENDYVLKSMTHPKEEKPNSDLKKDKSELTFFFNPGTKAIYGTCLSVPFQHAQYAFAQSLNISTDYGWRQAVQLTQGVNDVIMNQGIDGLAAVCASRQQFVVTLGLSYPTCTDRFYLLSLGNTDFFNTLVYNHLYKHLEVICSAGFDVYQYNFACIKQNEQAPGYAQCFQQFNQSINNNPRNFCDDTQDFTTCINTFFTGACNPWTGWLQCEMERFGFADDCPNFRCQVAQDK